MLTKYRWEQLGKEEDSEEQTKEEAEEEQLLAAESRKTFDPLTKTVNLAKLKATYVRQNARVFLPKGLRVEKDSFFFFFHLFLGNWKFE